MKRHFYALLYHSELKLVIENSTFLIFELWTIKSIQSLKKIVPEYPSCHYLIRIVNRTQSTKILFFFKELV